MSNNQLSQKTIKIYACGGGGINVGKTMQGYKNAISGAADYSITFVDTSKSNLASTGGDNNAYFIPNLDGSGKLRAENAAEIQKVALDIIQKHKPEDVNIIISTGAGGSGSVIAPVLARELLLKDKLVIVFNIGSVVSKIEATNTVNTLKSYESIARHIGIPVPVVYMENNKIHKRDEINAKVIDFIGELRMLFSGQNGELDSKDLYNLLRYTKVTEAPASVVSLSLSNGVDLLNELGQVITVASLTVDTEEAIFPIPAEYRCNGIVPEVISRGAMDNNPTFFVVSDGIIQQAIRNIDEVIENFSSQRASAVGFESILGDKSADGGLVL